MPFSKTLLRYRELSSREQITLVKANVVLPLDENNVASYSRILHQIVESCVENKDDLKKLNIIEYLMFIIKLRMISIGDQLELQAVEVNKEGTEETYKFNIDLLKLLTNLYNKCFEIFKDEKVFLEDIEVDLDWPNLDAETSLFINEKKDFELIIQSIPEYIKTIKIKEKCINFLKLNSDQRWSIYDSLPGNIRFKIQQIVLNVIKKFTEVDFYESSKKEYLKINYYNFSFQRFLRLLFTDSLKNIYNQYYLLASKKIPLNYVDDLSIAERNVYFSFIEEEYEAQKENSNGMSDNSFSGFSSGLMDVDE